MASMRSSLSIDRVWPQFRHSCDPNTASANPGSGKFQPQCLHSSLIWVTGLGKSLWSTRELSTGVPPLSIDSCGLHGKLSASYTLKLFMGRALL